MTQDSITFALHADGRTVHVDDVANGLACNCTCPSCGDRLIAKHGPKTAHHFAHESGAECATASESALHLAAKAILERERRLLVPSLTVSASAFDLNGKRHTATRVLPSSSIKLNDVMHEVRLGETIPDILATVGEKQLIIEIAVTSFADQEKVRRLAAQGIAAIEVDLSGIDRLANWDAITAAVIDRVDNKTWLFNPKAEPLRVQAEMDAKATADAERRHARTQARHLQQSLEYQRKRTQGFEDELRRFHEFISPESETALRSQLSPDGESEDAWQSAVINLRVEWDAPPAYLNVAVPGELSFLVDRRVWQAGIFLTFIHLAGHDSFARDDVAKWTYKCFEHRDGFPILNKHTHLLDSAAREALAQVSNPVTNYLQALEAMGFIAPKPRRTLLEKKRWKILRWG